MSNTPTQKAQKDAPKAKRKPIPVGETVKLHHDQNESTPGTVHKHNEDGSYAVTYPVGNRLLTIESIHEGGEAFPHIQRFGGE